MRLTLNVSTVSLDEQINKQDPLKGEDLEKGLRRNTMQHIEIIGREDTHATEAVPKNWNSGALAHERIRKWSNITGTLYFVASKRVDQSISQFLAVN